MHAGAASDAAAAQPVEMDAQHRGGCLCGAVRYRVSGELRPVIGCHCTQCRKTSGHFVAATEACNDALHISDEQSALAWYRSSTFARRGFCRQCGSSLFWRRDAAAVTSIMVGTLEAPTGLSIAMHIFTDDRGDYYCLPQSVPGHAQDAELPDVGRSGQ